MMRSDPVSARPVPALVGRRADGGPRRACFYDARTLRLVHLPALRDVPKQIGLANVFRPPEQTRIKRRQVHGGLINEYERAA